MRTLLVPLSLRVRLVSLVGVAVAFLLATPAHAQNTTLTLTRISIDNLYGVDANQAAPTGPNLSPVGVRISNTGSVTATNVTISMSLGGVVNTCGAAGNAPCVSIPGVTSYVIQTIPAGATFDYYFIIYLNNVSLAAANTPIGKTFTYTVSICGDNVTGAVCPTTQSVTSPTETVTGLNSQNRNTTDFTTCQNITVVLNQEFQCTVTSVTSSTNFDDLRVWQTWDGISFTIDAVSTAYPASSYMPPSPDCHSVGNCGAGNNTPFTQTVTLRAIAVGSYTVVPFILDGSGNSRHYNSGAGTTANITVVASSTAIEMRKLEARRKGAGAVLSWVTASETNNLGFRVYRENAAGQRRVLTRDLIAGSALLAGTRIQSSGARSYRFFDRSYSAGDRYLVEDVDLNGTTKMHGPVAVASAPASGADKVESSPTLSQVGLSAAAPKRAAQGFTAVRKSPSRPRRLAGPGLQARLAARPGMKILVNQEGWYRLSRQDLIAAGWDPGLSATNLQLYVEGQPVPMLVTDAGGGNYTMEFYGTGLDTVWADERVYWLALAAAPGTRIGIATGTGSSAPGPDFPFTVERQDHVVFVPGVLNGDKESWFGAIVGPPDFPFPADQSVSVTHLAAASASASSLEVALQGATTGTTHVVDVQVNGSNVGTVSFADQGYTTAQLSVPTSLLVEGTNAITLSARGATDYSLVDYVRLTYPHLFSADSDALGFAVDGGASVTIGGFGTSSVRVFDISNPLAPQLLSAAVTGSGPWNVVTSTPSFGTRQLLAVGASRVAAPLRLERNLPSSLGDALGRSRLVIVAHPSFLNAANGLKAHREAQGLPTLVANVTDVYDEFSFGEKSPDGIKEFLRSVGKKKIYVLLMGDGSADPRNYLGGSGITNTDFVPARLVQTAGGKTASDDWYVDFNDDGLPDLPIGRLTADTPPEAMTLVGKLVQYDGQGASSGVYLVAGANDANNDFEGALNALVPLVGQGKTPFTLRLSQLGADVGRSEVAAAFNNGQSLINWIGHGSETMWGNEDVLNPDQVALLSNRTRLPFVVAMDCLNASFQDPMQDTLAEVLLKASNGGAAAVWASSGLTDSATQHQINRALFRALFAAPSVRIGDAVKTAKAATANMDVRRTWIFLGDPSMVLK